MPLRKLGAILAAVVVVVVAGAAFAVHVRNERVAARTAALKDAFDRLNRGVTDPTIASAIANQVEEVLLHTPDDANALFALGWALQLANQPISAETRYREACLLAERGHLFDIGFYCRFNLGTLLEAQGQRAAAAAEFREAAQVSEHDTSRNTRDRAWTAWYRLGRVLITVQRYPEAIGALEQADLRSPANGLVQLEKARVLQLTHDLDAARAALDEALRLMPSLSKEAAKVAAEITIDENRRPRN